MPRLDSGLLAVMLLTLLPLAASGAPGKTPRPSAAPATHQVGLLIWGGGARESDGDAARADFERSGLRSSERATTLFSTGVKGLNPGYHIAVLGACPRGKAEAVIAKVKSLRPEAYLRWVANEGPVAALKCPAITLPPDPCTQGKPADASSAEQEESGTDDGDAESDRTVSTSRQEVTSGSCRLAVEVTEESDSNGEFEWSHWSASIELRKGSTVLDTKQLSHSDFASVEGLDAEGEAVILRTHDYEGRCSGDTSVILDSKVRRTIRIARGRIAVDEEATPGLGVCSPSMEGAAPCTYSCEFQESRTLEAVCHGWETREKCLAAVPDAEAEKRTCLDECKEKPEQGEQGD